jgi:hypothetical protein
MFGSQSCDGEFVEIAGDHDAGSVGPEPVELFADLAGQHAQVAGVDAYRAELGAGGCDRVGHPGRHVVGVDQKRGAGTQGSDLCGERARLVGSVRAVVQQREGVCAGALGRHAVAAVSLEVGCRSEAGEVGGARCCDGGTLVGAARAHIHHRPSLGGADHARSR